METLWLRIKAPFAAFRGFQAGVYRATSPIIPPSTALGLVLNLAAIEMRDSKPGPTTLIRADIPRLKIAIGLISTPERSTLYQQLHSYPVGASGKELAERTHGAKYWIAPVRREFLVGFDGIIGVQSKDATIFDRVRKGLSGELEIPRYGLPFAGDNNLMFDRIDILAQPPAEVEWYAPMLSNDAPRKGSCRLTVNIDRADNSRTASQLYAPLPERCQIPPASVWVWVPSVPNE